METIKKIYSCSCYSEAVSIEADDCGIAMCFWQLGLKGKPRSFKERLRWIWRILTTGDCWNDECILSGETALELGKDLIDLANKLPLNGKSGEDVR